MPKDYFDPQWLRQETQRHLPDTSKEDVEWKAELRRASEEGERLFREWLPKLEESIKRAVESGQHTAIVIDYQPDRIQIGRMSFHDRVAWQFTSMQTEFLKRREFRIEKKYGNIVVRTATRMEWYEISW